MDFYDLVALGGLFHDIGKPVQRAGKYGKESHPLQGYRFLLELARETGKPEFELMALFSRFHHAGDMNDGEIRKEVERIKPSRFGLTEEEVINALWIVYEADNFSSSEREEGQPQASRPLRSVFNEKMAYQLRELEFKGVNDSPDELPHPLPPEEVRVDYRKTVEGLARELSGVPFKVDRLLPVLEKYLTFVSSFTAENNVISLYDHMKMTSAIALAMARANCTAGDVKAGRCRNEKRFLLIEGDFSGIQDFIYGVSGKGTLKYLRARSAYLELIGWDVVLEILTRLGLTRANVVFNAGGHFLIVAQNTEEARRELEKIRLRVSEWLYRNFDEKLYLALEWEEVAGRELGKEGGKNLFKEARMRLKSRLNTRKLRRFGEVKGIFEAPKGPGRLEECPVCGREVPKSELEHFSYSDDPEAQACKRCNELAKLGEKLPKLKGFILDKKAHGEEGITTGPFRYLIPHERGSPAGEFLLLKNTLDAPGDIPEDTVFIPYPVADYYKEGKTGVATFEELANASSGTKRIGVLKGDVDNLGEFFKNMDSLSKLATASRFMDYFFKVYLKGVIHGKYGDLIGEVPSLKPWPDKPDIVVVYAGGDDFFIVGSWNQVFELAFRIREAFKAYTGGGRTVSMALGYFDEKTPIYRMADVVSERLNVAKDEGRNRVYIIERTRPEMDNHPASYTWDEYKELWKNYARKVYAGDGKLVKDLEGKKALLWRILQFRELYVRDPSSVRWAYLTAYLLGRHKLGGLFPKLVGIDVRAIKEGRPQEIYFVDGVFKVVLMAVRR
ncbi:CRISPR-associated protein, Csm1 family [Thermococcus sp. 2319x1]|uniref:type III-A CRISPR-associated protein Cas10/Csm1 n=1 Tax=Thermococcus sp. 2319x1 TaxID=1674923 RepID=UPI00073A6B98|nr:type III-A CRISPR-associated protein Cas10/Csm1 [Thermococcus sp. 2319x1]ALV63521.1 CRISPR-associated protein, Csm1 family [Thermococcus sp. 2319x1]